MNRGVMRLSTTLDCWKNNCQGATVVPTMAMMSKIASDDGPPWMDGTKVLRTTEPQLECTIHTSGTAARLKIRNTNMNRSQRRKLPVTVVATSRTAATGTDTS